MMDDVQPIISIVIPTKNRPDAIFRLLLDVESQEFDLFECIIVDDGSSREEKILYNEILSKFDRRFRYIEVDDKVYSDPGPSRARNFGIKAANGHYVAFCDDDDRWVRADHLSVAIKSLKQYDGDLFFAAMRYSKNLQDQFLYTPAMVYLKKNRLSGDIYSVSKINMSRFLSLRTLHCDTLVVKRSVLFESGLYFEKIKIAEDREFSYRLIDNCRRIIFRSSVCAELNISDHLSIFRKTELIDQYIFAHHASLRASFFLRNRLIRKAALKTAAWDLIQISEYFIDRNELWRAKLALRHSFFLYPTLYCLKLFFKIFYQGKKGRPKPKLFT